MARTYIITLTDNAKDAVIQLEVVCQRSRTTFARPEMSGVYHVWNPQSRESWQSAIRAADCTADGLKIALEECGHTVIIHYAVDYAVGYIDSLIKANGELA